MASDSRAEPTEWGRSSGLFGSDASVGTSDDASTSGRSSGGPKGRRSGSFAGAASSGGTWKARPAGGRSRTRKSFDDPFGPVVGASADASATEVGQSFLDSSAAIADEEGAARSSPRDRGRSAARRDDSLAPSLGDAAAPEGREDAETRERSDEEWASEGRSIMLRQLALGPRSRHQLGVKLAERDIPAAVADALLDRFEEVQLIDDAEFARMWVRTRTAAKALARSSIRRELAEKGVDPELAEDALLQISDEDEHDQARDIVRRKMRGNVDLSDRAVRDREVRRMVGVLARKGYGPGVAFTIVKNVMAETDAELAGEAAAE